MVWYVVVCYKPVLHCNDVLRNVMLRSIGLHYDMMSKSTLRYVTLR